MKRHLATIGLVFLVTLLTWHLGLMPAQGGNVNPSGGGGGGGGTGCNTTGTAILKGDGSGGCANALASTDYAPATSGTSILKGNGSGGFSSATSGTDYAPATSGNAILKGNGSGGFSNATSGVDYASGTLFGSATAGNPATYSSSSAVAFTANVIHAGSGTLATAFAACPAGNTPCTIYADPGQTYAIGNTPLAVGSSTKPETLIVDGAILNCNGTVGADCLEIFEKGRVIFRSAANAGTNGAVIVAASSANITSLITNGNHTNQAGFDLEGANFNPSRSATIAHGELWLSSADGFANITNANFTGPPNGGSVIEIDDGAAGTDFFNDITFIRPSVTCSGAESAKGVYIHHNAGNSGSNVSFIGGSIVDCSFSDSTPSTLLSIDGGSGSVVSDINFEGTYFETFCPGGDTCTGTGDIITLNNANDITLNGVKFNGGPKAANCIHVTGAGPGQINSWGRETAATCTDVVNNAKSGQTITSAGDFQYNYAGTNNGGIIYDPPIAVGNGGMPTAASACNMVFDNGATWVSLTPGGDFICGGVLGQLTLAGIDSIAFTGTHVSGSTTNGFWCTNGSGNYVACAAATDPATTPGDMLALSSAGTPNVYARVAAGAIGTVLSGMGATSTPANQVNEAPVFINYNIDGTISNSTNRWRTCPATLRYAPGLAALSSASPFAFLPASYAIAGTAPTGAGVVDTYTIQDAGTTIIDVYNPASGSPTFGTPGCSPSFDGTQGGAAFARGAGGTPSTISVTIPSASSSSAGILVCSVLGTDGTWTDPSGWTAVTGGTVSGTGISTKIYEANPLGSGSTAPGATATCSYSTSHTIGGAVYTVKGAPASGEIVDVIGATRVTSSASVTWPSVTTAHNGDFMMYILASAIGSGVLSAPSNPLILGQTSNGQGVATMYGGTAGAMAAQTGTSTSGTQYDVSLGILTGSTTCTLCTAGDKTEMIGPTTGTNGADLSVSIGGAK